MESAKPSIRRTGEGETDPQRPVPRFPEAIKAPTQSNRTRKAGVPKLSPSRYHMMNWSSYSALLRRRGGMRLIWHHNEMTWLAPHDGRPDPAPFCADLRKRKLFRSRIDSPMVPCTCWWITLRSNSSVMADVRAAGTTCSAGVERAKRIWPWIPPQLTFGRRSLPPAASAAVLSCRSDDPDPPRMKTSAQ